MRRDLTPEQEGLLTDHSATTESACLFVSAIARLLA